MPDETGQAEEQADYLVFLSHASGDKWIAKQMCEHIGKTGATFFRDDRDIDGGDDIPEEVRGAISLASEFVVLLTPQSLNRDWVRLEMGAAWGYGKRIVVVLHHMDADPLPQSFARRKAVQLNNFDEYIEELGKRIGGTS